MSVTLKLANLSLLILFPIAWFAPLLRAGLLPLFSLDEISTITAIQSLWKKDVFLALIVTFFALFAPVIKVAGTALVQFEFISDKALSTIEILGKLSMADVFLVAIYIVVAKGVGIGRIETGWGLYMFTACVLASMTITHITKRQLS
ncbi:MAG: paraquat-inducible protein A [Paracoccaceae bacterium]